MELVIIRQLFKIFPFIFALRRQVTSTLLIGLLLLLRPSFLIRLLTQPHLDDELKVSEIATAVQQRRIARVLLLSLTEGESLFNYVRF